MYSSESCKEKRNVLHSKLEIMKRCYQERSLNNIELIYDTFFDKKVPSIVIGTDNGEWFKTPDQIKELFEYDWQHWGDLHIDTYSFSITEEGPFDFIKVKGFLDFHEDRAWDIDILLVFQNIGDELVCRLMQFKIPRNDLKPTVIINKDDNEKQKYETERNEMNIVNAVRENQSDKLNKLNESLVKIILESKPYLSEIELPPTHVMYQRKDEYFYFGCTGLATNIDTQDILPFRMVGIGNDVSGRVEISSYEISHPFVCAYG